MSGVEFAKLAAFGIVAVGRGFPLDGKGKEKGKKGKNARCFLSAGLLAAVTSRSAALIAPHRSRAGRDLSYLLSSRPTQPGVPSGEPRGRMSRERQGKAALAGG